MKFNSLYESLLNGLSYNNLVEKRMHCWPGYKKKGTKKLASGKVVNNCVKNNK